MKQHEYERARDLGRQARRNGQQSDRNPYRGASVHGLAQAWLAGWNEVNSERGR